MAFLSPSLASASAPDRFRHEPAIGLPGHVALEDPCGASSQIHHQKGVKAVRKIRVYVESKKGGIELEILPIPATWSACTFFRFPLLNLWFLILGLPDRAAFSAQSGRNTRSRQDPQLQGEIESPQAKRKGKPTHDTAGPGPLFLFSLHLVQKGPLPKEAYAAFSPFSTLRNRKADQPQPEGRTSH